jgi:hypothetical protein
MKFPLRGEVWLVDLGLAANVRPAVVLSVPATESDRVLVPRSSRNPCGANGLKHHSCPVSLARLPSPLPFPASGPEWCNQGEKNGGRDSGSWSTQSCRSAFSGFILVARQGASRRPTIPLWP